MTLGGDMGHRGQVRSRNSPLPPSSPSRDMQALEKFAIAGDLKFTAPIVSSMHKSMLKPRKTEQLKHRPRKTQPPTFRPDTPMVLPQITEPSMKESKIRVGINGFGWVGKLVARAAQERGDIEVVAINDPNFHLPPESSFVWWYGEEHLSVKNTSLARVIGWAEWSNHEKTLYRHYYLFGSRKPFHLSAHENAEEIPWAKVGADYIIETNKDVTDMKKAAAHFKGGAKKVVICGNSEDVPMFVVGVNEHEYKPDLDIVSIASCTTNCLAPLLKIIHANFGILEGLVTTFHSINAAQETYDGPPNEEWIHGKEVPNDTGTAKAIGRVLPALNGKFTAVPFPIPFTTASVAHLTVRLEMSATIDQIKAAIMEESEGKLEGILGYARKDVISIENFVWDKRSCFFHTTGSIALGENYVMLVAWICNEWGYSNRVIDFIAHMARTDKSIAGDTSV